MHFIRLQNKIYLSVTNKMRGVEVGVNAPKRPTEKKPTTDFTACVGVARTAEYQH